MTPMKAIRAKCLECCNGQFSEVRLCPCADCPLYAYRFGRRPKDIKEPAEDADEEKDAASPMVLTKDRHSGERTVNDNGSKKMVEAQRPHV